MTEVAVWDIAALPPRQQFEYWHDVICRAFVPLTPHRTVDEVGFTARVETRPLAGLNRARLRARPQRTDHGPREIARTDGAYYFVNLQLAGRCLTTVGRDTTAVEAGQFVVVDTTEPYFFDLDQPWQMVSYRLPHSALTEVLRGRRPALGRPIDGTGAGAAVPALMTALWSLESTTPGAADLTASFAAAVAAATAGDGPSLLGPGDACAVTRAAVLAYVDGHLGDRDLTVHGVSRRFAISPRTLHNLFAAGESFAATVRRLRLERCAARLADPADRATISAVAAAHGFEDPTSFSRAFRRHFGVPPRDVTAPLPRSASS